MSEIKVFSSFRSFGLLYCSYLYKALSRFPKIGVALFVVLAFFIFLLPKKNVGTFLAMLIGGLSFAFITPVLNTPDEQVHLSRTIHIVEGNVNMGNKNIHITEDYFDVYKNFKKTIYQIFFI